MNFTTLSYFVTVAEELNITRAAEKLFISQQSLSSQILKLEKELNVKLFNRTPRFSLTYAGNRLLRSSKNILAQLKQVQSEIDDINHAERGEIKLGISHTRGRAILPDILPAFRQQHPGIEIKLVEDNSSNLEQELAHGGIDILIGFSPFMVDSVQSYELVKDELVLVVPSKFLSFAGENEPKLRAQLERSADLRPFAACPFLMLKRGNRIRTIIDDLFYSLELEPTIALETENIETAFALALRGMGITVYPKMLLGTLHASKELKKRYDVDFYPLNRGVSVGTLAIAYSTHHYLSKAARDFIQAAINLLGKKAETDVKSEK